MRLPPRVKGLRIQQNQHGFTAKMELERDSKFQNNVLGYSLGNLSTAIDRDVLERWVEEPDKTRGSMVIPHLFQ